MFAGGRAAPMRRWPLQAQPFVRADRVAWSDGAGGATILLAIRTGSSARPGELKADFRAAVALYPGLCDEQLQVNLIGAEAARSWTTAIPLPVLQGAADNWTRRRAAKPS